MDVSRRKPVLVLDEQILIAMYIEELLRQAGFDNVVTYSSSAEATAWLQNNSPQIVVMETRLRDGDCGDVAALLVERQIPFIIHSVEHNRPVEPRTIDARCRWIEKPCDAEDFMSAVRECTLVR